MGTPELFGKAQTVLGLLDPDELGVTLPHEHVLIDLSSVGFLEPNAASLRALAYGPITLGTVGWIRHNPRSHWDNLRLLDVQTAIDEVMLFKQAGGDTIVDATSTGIHRDPGGLVRISRATGVNIIMGSGHYVAASHPSDMDTRTQEDLAEEIVKDIVDGVGGTGVRAGIIGEVGCSWPWTENEKKAVRAAAIAQRRTGAMLVIHPGRGDPCAPLEIIDLVRDTGGNIGRTVIAHIDRTIFDYGILKRLAESGCYIEYDLFGHETSFYAQADIDMPNDGLRIDHIMWLISQGHIDQVLVSHDVGWKTKLVRYGGQGYGHLLDNVEPIMRRKGMTDEQIHTIFVENPKQALTFR
ncbi:aryldialkylphosphatase [Dehalococcoidia bacterium]|nr:aryldialkylphosphatase [Dehalococcoidia bacterium]